MSDERNNDNNSLPSDLREPTDLDEVRSALDSRLPERIFRIPLWGKIFIMSLFVFLGSIGYLRTLHTNENAQLAKDIQAPTESSDVPVAEKRKDVPNIDLVPLTGAVQKLAQYKGKVVLLSFWASWCTPCLVELPTFIDLHEKLAVKGLVIIAVNVDDKDAASEFVPSFWKTKKFPFQTFYDAPKQAADAFKIDTLPSNFVIDKKGKLVATGYGANDWASDASVHFIEQLLSE